MGYLRKTSFLIFHDPDAPAEEKTLDQKEIARIEAAHEAGKADRVDALIRGELGIRIPKLCSEAEQREALRNLADREDVLVPDKATAEVLANAIAEHRKQELEEADEETAEWIKDQCDGGADPASILELFPTDEAVVEAAKEAATVRVAGPDSASWRAIVQAVQDESIVDENAFRKYVAATLGGNDRQYLRDFAWEVYGIVNSKAKLPDLTYRPSRTPESTVRFRDGRTDRLGINSHIGGTRWDSEKQGTVATSQTAATLWMKVADGAWSKDANWGGRLQVSCATARGQWIRSRSDGWVLPLPAKGDPVTFYDMGPYYEIWQKDRESGQPLTVQDGYLRFVQGATPGKFNLQDSTWD